MVKLSIIIPSYNSGETILKSIYSIMNQNCADLEVIVIDDGSTDNTKEILEPFTSSNLIVYQYQENAGVAAARNSGLRLAKGMYIGFLDADDVFLDSSIAKRLRVFDEYEDVSIVFANFYLEWEGVTRRGGKKNETGIDRDFIRRARSTIKKRCCDIYIFNENFYYFYIKELSKPIWTGTVIMKRECVSRYGYFNPEYRIGEDNDYWIRIIEHSIVAYVNLPLCIYKRTEKSITKNKELYYKSVIKVYLNYIEKTFYKLTNNVETMFHLRRVIGDGYFELAYYFYNLNLYNETVKYSMRSILWLYLKPKTLKIFFLGLFRIKRSVLEKLIRKL